MPRREASSHRENVPLFDYLIVGAGFAGSVIAEQMARNFGKRVLLVDRRPHIGGNAYDHYNDDGILVHKYGPHIFHTNSLRCVRLSFAFTSGAPYEHRVLAQSGSKAGAGPDQSRHREHACTDLNSRSDGARRLLCADRGEARAIRTSEDVVVHGGPGAVRKDVPWLHAQAVGPGSFANWTPR